MKNKQKEWHTATKPLTFNFWSYKVASKLTEIVQNGSTM
jgi:hypothetical protein